jgi:hypothetical protein
LVDEPRWCYNGDRIIEFYVRTVNEYLDFSPVIERHKRAKKENCCMDTTPIVARLSVIANCVNALEELRPLTFEEFAYEHVLAG